ncbi:RsmD family RNA methyltransferase [Zavarzinella formosa]|uniref:RsmD family RNA methyltransferase n=1 Tax=Zavarzinella formosa TaxID=360055 RepID=UPI000306FF21|nr:RsmD family RNA methyltransferase [Zavarzinella formosa]
MKPERVEIRIVAGSLRGRKIPCTVHDQFRPTPVMVREALFSILGNAIPERPFFDLFAGSGVHGMEAVSRGASEALMVESDGKLVNNIDTRLKEFGILKQGYVVKADVYRWADRWIPPTEPVNVFVSPPFPDLTERFDQFLKLVNVLIEKMPNESVISLQTEDDWDPAKLPGTDWDIRKYGRNMLCIWVKLPASMGVKEEEKA